MRIHLFQPCFIDQLLPKVGIATVAVLERLGYRVECPTDQTCCGQPPFNAGYPDDARQVARHFLDVFDNADNVVVPSGSCATMIKVFYRRLLAGTPDESRAKRIASVTWELSDFLVNRLGITDVGATFPHRVTFHDGCHGLRELDIDAQPRRLLRAVRGLELVEMPDSRTCCGFGGTFAVKFDAISAAMAQVKCQSAAASGAEYVISNDSSCLMQIRGWAERNGLPGLRTLHLAEVLAHQ